MFTGIIEELGSVVSPDFAPSSGRLTIKGPTVAADATYGASIAVNGVCLTVVDVDGEEFTVDVMKETLDHSALGELASGAAVNLERAVKVSDRLGGHIVQGHVDGVGVVERRTPGETWEVVRIAMPAGLGRYVVHKGSIAVDGVSLTVSGVGEQWFEVSLIPTTLTLTTLGTRRVGERVNLEVDVVAKYVESLLGERTSDGTV